MLARGPGLEQGLEQGLALAMHHWVSGSRTGCRPVLMLAPVRVLVLALVPVRVVAPALAVLMLQAHGRPITMRQR